MSQKMVILYELNEVSWAVVDQYISERPWSCLARLVRDGTSLTTVVDDDVALQPWRTWPTLHKSLTVAGHNSYDLGQDPATFRGRAIWDVAEEAGLRVGLWGPLQSWPGRPFRHGGFFVPDTFARDATTFPSSMSRFQAFNLSATRENSFSSEAPLRSGELVGAGLDLLLRGLGPTSIARLATQIVRERHDRRYRGRRAVMQAVPSFDLYWRLHQQHRPHLSIFFTNHVAAMMHRYWGDGMPGYAETFHYKVDRVFKGFLRSAMDIVDLHLRRVERQVARNPDVVLVVAASMGQGAIPAEGNDRVLVLENPQRLVEGLGLGTVDIGLAMYPRVSLALADGDEAVKAVEALQAVLHHRASRPVFRHFRVSGHSVSFEIDHEAEPPLQGGQLAWQGRTSGYGELGLAVRRRLGGANTAYHVPEGMLLVVGDGVPRDVSRRKVDILDVAPTLLADILDVVVPAGMQGRPHLFESV